MHAQQAGSRRTRAQRPRSKAPRTSGQFPTATPSILPPLTTTSRTTRPPTPTRVLLLQLGNPLAQGLGLGGARLRLGQLLRVQVALKLISHVFELLRWEG